MVRSKLKVKNGQLLSTIKQVTVLITSATTTAAEIVNQALIKFDLLVSFLPLFHSHNTCLIPTFPYECSHAMSHFPVPMSHSHVSFPCPTPMFTCHGSFPCPIPMFPYHFPIPLFPCQDSDPADYCLVEVSQVVGVRERMVDDNECPGQHLQDLRKVHNALPSPQNSLLNLPLSSLPPNRTL